MAGCRWLAMLLLIAIGGCAGTQRHEVAGPSVADLLDELPDLQLPERDAVRPSRDDVLAAYEQVYGLIDDSRVNHAVGKRLADLRMDLGEERNLAGVQDPYQDAVALYEQLLQSSEREDRDQILYQLARAHDLAGESAAVVGYLDRLIERHPDSDFALEARFRRAEIAFSAGRYRAAAQDYGHVAGLGADTPYWQNATYMQGWARFKLGELEAGLESFFAVLDSLLAERDSAELPDTEQQLLGDSLRVATLALGYLDGPATLAEQMRTLDRPAWQYQVYGALADDYLRKERYLDSVATWQRFIEENSLDPRAPNAHIGLIETLEAADFPSEVRPRKEEFVARYGAYSEFWSVHEPEVRAGYLETLHVYLRELANLAHGEAQDSQVAEDYLRAGAWYEQIVVTFPEDPSTARYLFLLGEVCTEAEEHARAVAAYQRVVHDYVDHPRAAEAGYAAILGLQELVVRAPTEELELWQRLKIDAQIEFAMLFSADGRAPAAQTAAADGLFELGDFEEAVNLADDLLATWPVLAVELETTALSILGHGHFELSDYVAAEAAYRRLLALQSRGSELAAVEERLLASVYKQAEASEAAGDSDAAVAHYLRLRDVSPQAELTVRAHFDAVAVVEESGNTAEAAALLRDFRYRYPDQQLTSDIEKRLAAMYEQTGDWASAAAEYVLLSERDRDPEVRRQSLYRAAELYLEHDEKARAIAHFTAYADAYPKPLALNLEAVHQLDLLHQALGEPGDRRLWLERKIRIHRKMGSSATARATSLAAEAQYVLAEDERAVFDAIALTHPLARSLARKQKALKRSVRAFEAVADYGVQRFTTASTYHIGHLYAALSASILASDRPQDLSALELEQYDILLEEQAFPFEEQAIAVHEINMHRSWEGVYDEWVQKSFAELSRLMPARFDKREIDVAYVENIH